MVGFEPTIPWRFPVKLTPVTVVVTLYSVTLYYNHSIRSRCLQPPPGVLHFPVTSLLRIVVYLPKHGSGFAPLYQHWAYKFVLICSCPIAYSCFSYAMQQLKGMMSLIPFIPPTHFLRHISSHNMISAVLYQYRAVMYIRITMSTFNYKRNKHYT